MSRASLAAHCLFAELGETVKGRKAKVSRLPTADPSLLNKLAWVARWSDVKRSRDNARKAYRDASEGEGRRSDAQRGLALRTMSWHDRWRGDFEQALKNGLKAEEFLPEHQFPEIRAAMYANLAVIHFSRGRFDLANSSLERALLLINDDSDPECVMEVLCTKALVQTFSGDKTRAGLTLGRARDRAGKALVATVEHLIARWLLDDGDTERAAMHIGRAIEAAEAHENNLILPLCYEVRALCEITQRHLEQASETLEDALELSRDLECTRSEIHLTFAKSIVQQRQNDIETALATLKRGARMAASADYVLYQRKYALELADVFERMGQLRQALEQHKIAWRFQKAIRS